MKIVIAPDSFKGSLKAHEVASIIAKAARTRFPAAEIVEVPIADGGEGTLEILTQNLSLEKVPVVVTGPDFQKYHTWYAKKGDTAYIEMAKTSGLGMSKLHSARKTNSRGFGEAILHAVKSGAKTLCLAIGGSATNDGGMGMLEALGVQFLDENGQTLPGMGESLGKVKTICTDGFLIKNIDCYVLCDVDNPLLGENGATRVYGRQKGATEEDLEFLEKGMENYARCMEAALLARYDHLSGAGAAGGVGAALFGFLHAKFCPGIETVLDHIGFDETVKNADLIITGEGQMDRQSAFGKAPVGVAARCLGKPVIAIVGSMGEGFEAVYEKGITSVFSIFTNAMPLSEAILNAAPMLESAADRLFRVVFASLPVSK